MKAYLRRIWARLARRLRGEWAFARFLLPSGVYGWGLEILERGKHSLENLEPRSRVSYVVDDTRVGSEA
jgi:hypothetical protein